MKLFYALMLLLVAIFFLPKQSSAQVNKNDSLALIDLYNSTNGNQWTNNSGWLHGPVSGWVGVQLSGTRVVKIDLNNNNLTGSLPSSINKLSALQDLELYQNHIGGTIPSSIGSMPVLNNIYLFENELTGSIPSSIGKMQSLMSLSLANNHLTGKIPTSLGSTAKINFLVLSYNNLSGIIPLALGNCKFFQLSLDHNQLTGTIPDTLKNSTYDELDLDHNQLSGNIPEWLGALKHLWALTLNNNKFTGTIPQSFGTIMPGKEGNYSGLDFSNNLLSGPVPGNLSNPNIYLHTLTIFNNYFNFDSIEYIQSHRNYIQYFNYAPQYLIKLHSTNHNTPNVFSVSAGGTLSNNTYKWYKNGVLVKTSVGDSTYTTTDSGRYAVQVTNSIATALTLVSDTVFYNPAVQLTVSNISVTEGNSGTTTPANFSVRLSKAANVTVTVNYATKNGTAVAGQDYVAKLGTLSFLPGQISKRVTITVNGDGTPESNEQFYLQLSNATNAVTAAKDSAICTIVNDDTGLIGGATSKLAAFNTTAILSPNPVINNLHLKIITDKSSSTEVVIVNSDGKVVMSKVINIPAGESVQTINTAALSSGTYFLNIKFGEYQQEIKFVKL